MAEAKNGNITAELSEKGISSIRLTASAYFYKVKDGLVSCESEWKNKWEEVCKAIFKMDKKKVQYISEPIWGTLKNEGENTAYYGVCVFKVSDILPSFATNFIDKQSLYETKTGYFVLVVYNGYVAITMRNATMPLELKTLLIPIDYTALAALNEKAVYSKISMKNLDSSSNVIRAKTLSANSLQSSMPYMGANRYAINTVNGKKGKKNFVVALSTSHIGEYGKTENILAFTKWAKLQIDAIHNEPNSEIKDFLSIFATPVSYSGMVDQLTPVSFLIFIQEIVDIIRDENCQIRRIRSLREVSKEALKRYLEMLFSKTISLTAVPDSEKSYQSDRGDITIEKQSEGLAVKSKILRDIHIYGTPDNIYDGTLNQLINQENLFSVYFADTKLVYTNGSLFRDHKLLNSKELLLNVLDDDRLPALANVKTEKSEDSIFSIVEEEFSKQEDNEIKEKYLICADLGTEWADHILIEKGKVTFFAEKCKKSIDSASAFQDVVGQALKNLGYFYPTEGDLKEKHNLWKKKHPDTEKNRLIYAPKGKGLSDAIEMWKENMNDPLYQKEMALVVNFIAKNDFKADLEKAQNEKDDAKTKATTYQRLWILSSFANACIEVGVVPKIYCIADKK